MSGHDATIERFTALLAGFGDAIGQIRQRMISSGVPDHVADQVLCEVAREFTRTWSRRRHNLDVHSGPSHRA